MLVIYVEFRLQTPMVLRLKTVSKYSCPFLFASSATTSPDALGRSFPTSQNTSSYSLLNRSCTPFGPSVIWAIINFSPEGPYSFQHSVTPAAFVSQRARIPCSIIQCAPGKSKQRTGSMLSISQSATLMLCKSGQLHHFEPIAFMSVIDRQTNSYGSVVLIYFLLSTEPSRNLTQPANLTYFPTTVSTAKVSESLKVFDFERIFQSSNLCLTNCQQSQATTPKRIDF